MVSIFGKMETLQFNNPFGAPVYYKKTVTSTMDEARLLKGTMSGTVIAAGEQTAGRGRSGRPWKMDRDKNLSLTIIFRYGTIAAIPPCLTLKAGLAVSGAIEDFTALVWGTKISPLAGRVLVKWPNDIMLLDKNGRGKKTAGILTEAEDGNVYLGIGANIAQRTFPPELEEKACSIAQALVETMGQYKDTALVDEGRFSLLELILSRLKKELKTAANGLDEFNRPGHWRQRLEERLYLKDQRVCFTPGLPEEISCKPALAIEGMLKGIGQDGEILIVDHTGELHSFITGELKAY